MLPPNKIALMPPKELMLDFTKPKNRATIDQLPTQVLFGVHDYDIQAINILDKVMSKPTEDFFNVTVGSKIGEKLVELPFFEDSSWKIKRVKDFEPDFVFSPKTAKIIEENKDSQVWDKLAKICLGCGVCSYVCPLCYCF